MLVQVLTDLGLSEKEAQVYLALLEIGSQPVSTVAKSAGINRTTCYVILEELGQKGLVSSFIRANIKYFSAAPPSTLEAFLANQKKQITSQESILHENIEALMNVVNKESIKPKVYFLEGLSGIQRTYEDTLKEGQTICAIESVSAMSPEVKKWIYGSYIPKRKKAGIFAHAILTDTPEHREFQKLDEKQMRKTKLIANDLLDFQIELNIYGNKSSFIAYQESNYTSVIIENEAITKSLKSMFDLVWNDIK